jgi:hypothetical protein
VADGGWAVIEAVEDVQIGWYRRESRKWFVETTDPERLNGPFGTMRAAAKAAVELLRPGVERGGPGG